MLPNSCVSKPTQAFTFWPLSLNHKSFSKCLAAMLCLSLGFACTRKTAQSVGAPVQPKEPTSWNTTKPDASDEPIEVTLDDLVVMPDGGTQLRDTIEYYNASATKTFDLEHTEIRIAFDFAKRHAPAQATLTLKPWFKATDQLVLDAKNFEIKKVALVSGTDLRYKYDGNQLTITLDRAYTRTESVKVRIDYVARPDDRANIGGSDAISSDKGLYFIDPDGTDPYKPTQIWTQGETEASSRWFPTIDKPNQRTTSEIYITVANQYKTLSNGVLVSSKPNTDGTRTDYYKMDKPHAPYLFMMAVGEFAKVSDKWRGIAVDYYVEPEYEAHARDIYPHTVEMLEFFSNKLGYAYPWPTFSQVIVRDYVSGAMENTTAVIFGEFIQQDKRSLMDGHWTNEKIVAHEMFHHWFGDLVTCESWANLTLNEGFANYSEYLWLEHKHGREEADAHLDEEHLGYISSNGDGGHPLIHYHYGDKEQMFDAVSYNKGGSILHMLRKYLGDEAFFAGLGQYLRKNEYTDVESSELRMALEEVSGEDLHWFFDQWFDRGGFPKLEISYDYDNKTKEAIMRVKQVHELQAPEQTYVFDLPIFVDLYKKDGTRTRESARITKREQEVRWAVSEKPLFINFDAEKVLVCEKTDNHSADEWMALFQYGPLYKDRAEALEAFESLNEAQRSALIYRGLQDKSRNIRLKTLSLAKDLPAEVVKRMATTDPDPAVRSAAIKEFGSFATAADLPLLRINLQDDQAYSVVASAFEVLSKIAPDTARAYSTVLQSSDNGKIAAMLAKLYHTTADAKHLPWYEAKATKVNFEEAFEFFEYYQIYLVKLKDPTALQHGIKYWQQVGLDHAQSAWRRFAATKALADMRNHYAKSAKVNTESSVRVQALNETIQQIKSQEKDKTLLMYYEMF
jgi:aminopeptidase N